ncbi:formate/nitrite transporter family protein [Oscillatoria laete-virens NRMC-F 0139]|nr:formate/nitrite transporter family protein [Oscillatoria laete-virens]MDL5053960.1 formate/nitrite transporter family protein [Oscillatoria laete-virens NRMC-F 0139]
MQEAPFSRSDQTEKPAVFGFDAYSPKEIAERVDTQGISKARLPFLQMAALGIMAGAFIGLGAMFYTLIVSDPTLNFTLARLLGGLAFSLGLILVVVAGAELFTGNNLLVMALMSGKITLGELLKNWLIILVTNFIGAMALVVIVVLSGHAKMNNGLVGLHAIILASAKCSAPWPELFFKGVLCNLLVCLAVWMAMAGRSVTDKVLACIFPVAAFVAAGFEHSVANMYFIPLGLLLKGSYEGMLAGFDSLTWAGLIHNLIPVILGNIVGGSVIVALIYYVIYRRKSAGAK